MPVNCGRICHSSAMIILIRHPMRELIDIVLPGALETRCVLGLVPPGEERKGHQLKHMIVEHLPSCRLDGIYFGPYTPSFLLAVDQMNYHLCHGIIYGGPSAVMYEPMYPEAVRYISLYSSSVDREVFA